MHDCETRSLESLLERLLAGTALSSLNTAGSCSLSDDVTRKFEISVMFLKNTIARRFYWLYLSLA